MRAHYWIGSVITTLAAVFAAAGLLAQQPAAGRPGPKDGSMRRRFVKALRVQGVSWIVRAAIICGFFPLPLLVLLGQPYDLVETPQAAVHGGGHRGRTADRLVNPPIR